MNQRQVQHIIGLTGNIATGKGEVCKVLQEYGSYVIDIDALVGRAVLKDAPAYQPLLIEFGVELLGTSNEIDREKLDRLILNDPDAEVKFNALLLPIISKAVNILIHHSSHAVVVINDSKLFENGLDSLCDSIWVTYAEQPVQIEILALERGIRVKDVMRLVTSQPPQDKTIEKADVVIHNIGSYDSLVKQVNSAWQGLSEDVRENRVSNAWRPPAWQADLVARQHQEPDTEDRIAFLVRKQTRTVEFLEKKPPNRAGAVLRLITGRIVNTITTLLVIAYLTSLGLILAERGREHLPANPLNAMWESLLWVYRYIVIHPQTYFWNRTETPAFGLVAEILLYSAILLLLALGVALVVGMSLGTAAALSKRKVISSFIMVLSVLGVSTPSFLLAMIFWVINIMLHRRFGLTVLPSAGFGLDTHMIMPVLVLSMRPLAQIAQVSFVSLTDVLRQDYIRTARAKGLSWRLVRDRHAVRNVLIPVLTTLGTSLRFSLASLPVVELFFDWPGVGQTLLDAISKGETTLVIDLILSLGLFFLLVNLAIEVFFPLIDPRLRENKGSEEESRNERTSFLGFITAVFDIVRCSLRDFFGRFRKQKSDWPSLPDFTGIKNHNLDYEPAHHRSRWVFHSIIRNPSLIVGTLLVMGLIFLVFFGSQLTSASPYKTHGVMMIEENVYAPPFEPSSVFPWGSDYVGRDMQALVLSGARQTLVLAFFGMLMRVLLGAVFGALAGWQRGGWLDRLVTNAISIWAAFPVTLFAMIMIQALGIQQGLWVFVLTLSVVGWGEVAQIVRSQVLTLKPQPYVESAYSVGARSDQIMVRHIVPNLVNSLIVLAVLETGGILMLLAELGYLNIFMGGGFSAMIGETGRMVAVIVKFSDVPEWAAIIANVRQWWRSYPWMALYPGLAFFLSIMAFNLMGDGLRRFLDDAQANLSRLFNRYTFILGVIVVAALIYWFQATAPLGVYRSEANNFDEQRVLEEIRVLSSPEFEGRETGNPGAEKTAMYIEQRMIEIGLQPGAEGSSYIQSQTVSRYHLMEVPVLEITDERGNATTGLVYRQDYTEVTGVNYYGNRSGPVVGLAFGEILDLPGNDPYRIRELGLEDAIVLVRKADLKKVPTVKVAGILVVTDEPLDLQRRNLYPGNFILPGIFLNDGRINPAPVIIITEVLADQLLESCGSNLADLDRVAGSLAPGQVSFTDPGRTVHLEVNPVTKENIFDEQYYNVIGVLPGKGADMGLDDQVIIVSAYYDGLGIGPDGTLYPGANDNASGVAMMLELARQMKESAYQPDKTMIFVGRTGGERSEGLSVKNIMGARSGFNQLTVEAVIELSGVGAGEGEAIAIGQDSSYRMVKLFQRAAKKYGIEATTRGRGPHYGNEIAVGFGGRSALTLSISWDGADELAHTPYDTPEIIDPQKLRDVGRSTLLSLYVASRETEY
ncbi:MAG: dephospho-CoA kinase [Anaerolineales bacterium]|nr:dephospho-CoA kinase [Anaerolineales bacterium]